MRASCSTSCCEKTKQSRKKCTELLLKNVLGIHIASSKKEKKKINDHTQCEKGEIGEKDGGGGGVVVLLLVVVVTLFLTRYFLLSRQSLSVKLSPIEISTKIRLITRTYPYWIRTGLITLVYW